MARRAGLGPRLPALLRTARAARGGAARAPGGQRLPRRPHRPRWRWARSRSVLVALPVAANFGRSGDAIAREVYGSDAARALETGGRRGAATAAAGQTRRRALRDRRGAAVLLALRSAGREPLAVRLSAGVRARARLRDLAACARVGRASSSSSAAQPAPGYGEALRRGPRVRGDHAAVRPVTVAGAAACASCPGVKRPLPPHHGHVTVLGEPPRLEMTWPVPRHGRQACGSRG